MLSYCFANNVQITMVDGYIFGGKASEPETSRPVENAIFAYPTCIWHPCWGYFHRNFVKIFCILKLDTQGYHAALFLRPYV